MRIRAFFKHLKLKWRVTALLFALSGGFLAIKVFFSDKAHRRPAQFSSVELEYGETLLEGEETTEPDLEISPSYEDTVVIPKSNQYESIDSHLAHRQITDYKKALTEEIAQRDAERVRRELAERIIERNRREGYEVVLDKDFNIVSVTEIKSLDENPPSDNNPPSDEKTSSDEKPPPQAPSE